jgi:hypothetical protein
MSNERPAVMTRPQQGVVAAHQPSQDVFKSVLSEDINWKNAARRRSPELHLIECHRFAALRRVEERSLSSILHSKLLTTFMNNDVSGKVNASGCASALHKFERNADVFRVWIDR